ncbi:hypothetical protein BJF85_05965 [Saccharomonospora sp. CUA-673]|nr:hypothetical protein BJF85_05965 [Saccharomonospora sp. CUA-673]
MRAGISLLGAEPDVVIVHRDADNAGVPARRAEITDGVTEVSATLTCCPVIPIRMTEAWLLLDDGAIRRVAGNPKGKSDLGLPHPREVERIADPKQRLRDALLAAADKTGRRRERGANRFDSHRRQLLERLDPHGPISRLDGWNRLVEDVDRIVDLWRSA